jgi:two-component system sensor histidine kinase YesM
MISSVMMLVIVALLISFALYSDARLVDQAIDNASQKLSTIAQKLDMMTKNIEDTAVFVLTNTDVQTWLFRTNHEVGTFLPSPVSMASYLYTMVRMEYITNIVIHPVNREKARYALFSYNDPCEAQFIKDFFDGNPLSLWQMNKGVRFVQGSQLSASKSPYMLAYTQKVYDKWTMEALGAVTIMTSESLVSAFYEDIPLGESGWFAALDREGNVISSKDKSMLGQCYAEFLGAKEGEKHYVNVDLNGADCLLLTLTYERLGWTLVGVVPVVEITGANRMLFLFALVIGLIALMLALAVSGILATHMSKPILELKELMIVAGTGDRSMSLPLDRRDEIGDLNRAFVKMLQEIDDLNHRVIDKHNKQREVELSLLLSQLSPHFLYNTLECICGLAMLGKNKDVIESITELACFYRNVFSGKGNLTSVADELGMAQCYFNIIKFRYPGKLEYDIDCDPDVSEKLIVKLALQPIIENAIIHGLRDSRNPWKVEIRAHLVGDSISISVWDNGVGMDADTISNIFSESGALSSRAHFGLHATNERIRLICGEAYGLTAYSNPGEGTMIVVSFPGNMKEGSADV